MNNVNLDASFHRVPFQKFLVIHSSSTYLEIFFSSRNFRYVKRVGAKLPTI